MKLFVSSLFCLSVVYMGCLLGMENKAKKTWDKNFPKVAYAFILYFIQLIPYLVYNNYVNIDALIVALDLIYILVFDAYLHYLMKRVNQNVRNKYLIISVTISTLYFSCCYLFL